MSQTFSITDTANGTLNSALLAQELGAALAPVLITAINTSGLQGEYLTSRPLTSEEITLADGIIAAHDGSEPVLPPEPQVVKVVDLQTSPPFAAKTLPDGSQLFKRKHGVNSAAEIAPGQTVDTIFLIPYTSCKITEVEVVSGHLGDSVDFAVLDTASGAVSGFPSAALNQFGFTVYITEGFYRESSNYDADLFAGLQLSMSYTNNGDAPVRPKFNVLLHEVRPPNA